MSNYVKPFREINIREEGIDSMSFNPDALLKEIENMVDAETQLNKKKKFAN